MKGAILDWIRSMTGGPIVSNSDIVYSDPPPLYNLEDNALVTKAMLLSVVPVLPSDQISTEVVGGVTPNPLTVTYLVMTVYFTGNTTAAGGVYNNLAPINITGTGAGALFNITVDGGNIISIKQVSPGAGYNVNDTFSLAAIPNVIFKIVGISNMVNPTLIFRNADGSNYSGGVNNTDTGTQIVLTGDDDGAGHFADSFTFIIKP